MFLVALDAGDVHLNFNNAGINAVHGRAKGFVEHRETRFAHSPYAPGLHGDCDRCHKGGVMDDLVPEDSAFSIEIIEITKCDLKRREQI